MAKDLTAKQRVSRIPLDYHKHSDAIRKNRNRIAAVAAVLAIGLVAAIAVSREFHTRSVSPGPVARVHMAWEQQCSVCHKDFIPIHEDARRTTSTVGAGDSTSIIKEKCQVCHKSAAHHPHQSDAATESCAACHHDHRGDEALLTEVEDRACTRCHAQIKDHVAAEFKNAPSASIEVTSFPFQHPEFESLASDPTRLKFNHHRHLLPGLKSPAERQPAWTLADVAPDVRSRYRRLEVSKDQSGETNVFQLECSDCHVSVAEKAVGLGAGAGARLSNLANLPRNQPPLATGAYMLPVKFEDHCQGCHPLAIDRSADAVVHGLDIPHGLEVPHRVQTERMRQLLEGRFWERQSDDLPEQKASRSRIRPFPGQAPGRLGREAKPTIESNVRGAETHLQAVACKKCHNSQNPAEPDGLIAVEPVNMPAVWLQRSQFNHRAHQSVTCQECHPAATSSTQTGDVLIAGLAKCRECHTPLAGSRPTQSDQSQPLQKGGALHKTGADYRCVECHRYHRGDLSAAGPATAHEHGKIQQSVAPLQEGDRARE